MSPLSELATRPQWVNWAYQPRKSGKPAKIPLHPVTCEPASVTDKSTWADCVSALFTMRARHVGLGFVVTQDDPLVAVDMDGCVDVDCLQKMLPGAYVELSPSGKGLHALCKGTLDVAGRRVGKLEVYSWNRFITITGKALYVPPALPDLTSELKHLLKQRRTFANANAKPTATATAKEYMPSRIKHILRGHPIFLELFVRGDTSNYPSPSEADYALACLFAQYTHTPEHIKSLLKQSALYRAKHEREDYLERTVQKAIAATPLKCATGLQVEERSVPATGMPVEEARKAVSDQIAQFARSPHNLLLHAPCGTGKTYAAADLLKNHNVAWLAMRHDMADQVKPLATWKHVRAPSEALGCTQIERHARVARLGYATGPVHENELECRYQAQFGKREAVIYMQEYTPTSHIEHHDLLVLDEFVPNQFFEQHEFKIGELPYLPEVEPLLTAFGAVAVLPGEFTGRQLFNRLPIETLAELPEEFFRLYPPYCGVEERVVWPYILNALRDECAFYRNEQGRDWASCIRVEHGHIFVLRPRPPASQAPILLLDATANPEVASRMLGRTFAVQRLEVALPAGNRHIAVRTGKAYSKTNLVDRYPEEHCKRLVHEINSVLRHFDIRPADCGLITFQDIEEQLAHDIGCSSSAHFWGLRGLNTMENTPVLVVAGTPIPSIDRFVLPLAHVLYRGEEPLDRSKNEHHKFNDKRVAELITWLAQAELTQACHRNRPLVHPGRTVISLCRAGIEVLNLPITHVVSHIPARKPVT